MATLDANLAALCADLNADAVKEIIETDLTDAQINAFLNTAYYITRPLSGNLGACGGATAECNIIMWLAAHFITIRERQTSSESVAGEWSVKYLGEDGLGLDASLYGQQALVLDCSGMLARVGLKRPFFEVISYEDLEEQTPPDSYMD